MISDLTQTQMRRLSWALEMCVAEGQWGALLEFAKANRHVVGLSNMEMDRNDDFKIR